MKYNLNKAHTRHKGGVQETRTPFLFPEAGIGCSKCRQPATSLSVTALPIQTNWQIVQCPLGGPGEQTPRYLRVRTSRVWNRLTTRPRLLSFHSTHRASKNNTNKQINPKGFHEARLRKHKMSFRKALNFSERVPGHILSAICICGKQLSEASARPAGRGFGVSLGSGHQRHGHHRSAPGTPVRRQLKTWDQVQGGLRLPNFRAGGKKKKKRKKKKEIWNVFLLTVHSSKMKRSLLQTCVTA